VSTPTRVQVRWRAVGAGFVVTAVCALVLTPLLERAGLNLNAGPVDALSMLSILAGGFVAGRLAGRFEGMHGAIVAVLYIAVIALGGTALAEIPVAQQHGLGALGKVDSWGNFGRDFFHFVAGALGGLWATPLNERDRQRDSALLRSAATARPRPRREAMASPTDETDATDATTEIITPPSAEGREATLAAALSAPRGRKKRGN